MAGVRNMRDSLLIRQAGNCLGVSEMTGEMETIS